jgi:MFS family permease
MPVTPTEAIGALNVGGVDDHQHSGEVSASPFAPFRHRAFFWLWLGVVIASIGSWGQMVGAQWLFVNDPNAATIVPLVQTASTLPMMLLALPAGVLADAFDRRWMMFVIQVYFITVSALLAILTALGRMPPALLLTFAVGAGQAMLSPTWQAMITELVPRSEFAAATRLDMVSVNVSRAAGPAIAGFVIAAWGVPPVFALNVATGCVLAVILLAWHRPPIQAGRRERFLPALRSGGRYVRHEPVVRTILLRFATFIFPAGAVWALLPLIASRQLGLAANGYGILFAARSAPRLLPLRSGAWSTAVRTRSSISAITRQQVRPTTTAGYSVPLGHRLWTGGSGTTWSWLPRRSSRAAPLGADHRPRGRRRPLLDRSKRSLDSPSPHVDRCRYAAAPPRSRRRSSPNTSLGHRATPPSTQQAADCVRDGIRG